MKIVYANAGTAALAFFWVGLVFGVSFLATMAKFNAPSLTLPVALDVGRFTFAWLYRAEWIAAIVLGLALVLAGFPAFRTAAFAILAIIVVLQAFWLLPGLSARVDIVQGGGTPPPSPLHLISVACEAGKLVLLLFIGIAAVRDLLGAAAR